MPKRRNNCGSRVSAQNFFSNFRKTNLSDNGKIRSVNLI